MPTSVPRISVTPSCQAHADLLEYWSVLEGRSVSNLCSALLEDAIVNAIQSGRANPQALEMMNKLMDERKEKIKVDFGNALLTEREKSNEELDRELSIKDSEQIAEAINVAEEAISSEKLKKNIYVNTPDLNLIQHCLQSLGKDNNYAEWIETCTEVLMNASMADLDIVEITNSVIQMQPNEGYRDSLLSNVINGCLEAKRKGVENDSSKTKLTIRDLINNPSAPELPEELPF